MHTKANSVKPGGIQLQEQKAAEVSSPAAPAGEGLTEATGFQISSPSLIVYSIPGSQPERADEEARMRGIRVAHEAIQRFRQESLEGADGEQTVSPVQQVSTQHPTQDEYTSPKGAEAMNT